jgi:hypothetical protein
VFLIRESFLILMMATKILAVRAEVAVLTRRKQASSGPAWATVLNETPAPSRHRGCVP